MGGKIMLSWSSGKDSAWALHLLAQRKDVEVVGLFSTLNRESDRVAMHGVRRELLYRQAASTGLPVELITLPHPCSNQDYEAAMGAFVERTREAGVSYFAFGDIHLRDVRRYREERLTGSGITPLFPLWGKEPRQLAEEMIGAGLKARITCIDPGRLPVAFAGAEYNRGFLDQLPPGVDPCGENGEFHSFAFAGPMFRNPVAFHVGETLDREGFLFTDLLSVA